MSKKHLIVDREKALIIARQFAEKVSERFGEALLAVYVIGSLGADYYRPGQSDIDTVLIFSYHREEMSDAETFCRELADEYWKKYDIPKGFGAIVFAEEQLFPPYYREEELILEILRLKTQGLQIYGSYDTTLIPTPDKTAALEDAKHFQEWVDEEKEQGSANITDVTMLVNSSLIALKRFLLLERGIIEFNKFNVIPVYLANNPPVVFENLFGFIQSALTAEEEPEIPKQFRKYIEEHDQLYEIINAIVFREE